MIKRKLSAEGHAVFRVFYSWQTDLPTKSNRGLIREALSAAGKQLEADHTDPKLIVIIDDATRGEPGSPNIPQTIMSKIKQADAFVCDITTINRERREDQRAVPNPNVLIELGYAIGQVGWKRIVGLFNTSIGQFPGDVPFDIDRHRLSKYEYESSEKDKSVNSAKKTTLIELCYQAIKAIYDSNPLRPWEEEDLSPEEQKRKRDRETLIAALSYVHIPTMDWFFYRAEFGIIPDEIFYYWNYFNDQISRSLFHIYDKSTSDVLLEFHANWSASLSFGDHFVSSRSGDEYHFHMQQGGDFMTPSEMKTFQDFQLAVEKAKQSFHKLLAHIRENSVEIDLNNISQIAGERHSSHKENIRKRSRSSSSEP